MTQVQDVVSVRDEQELFDRTAHLFTHADEVVCAANDLHTWATMRGNTDLPQPRRPGVRGRKIYRPQQLLDPASAPHLQELREAGMEIRISEREINETIIIDHRIAILAAGRGYTVLLRPDLVHGIKSLVEATWRTSTALAAYETRFAELRQYTPQLIELLASGCTDEKAAREMGVGLRTYRRRVAELMSVLGASSRFQAGARAREAGLV
ncbi:DNA-binding response regulator [Amycolatopsis ultiminotia]|uniref:helix-turn-helix transcriptional regulator n=1 Tax=Amycolatopsis ultiminotia TaxID=543629 RepID=UPI0031EE45BC